MNIIPETKEHVYLDYILNNNILGVVETVPLTGNKRYTVKNTLDSKCTNTVVYGETLNNSLCLNYPLRYKIETNYASAPIETECLKLMKAYTVYTLIPYGFSNNVSGLYIGNSSTSITIMPMQQNTVSKFTSGNFTELSQILLVIYGKDLTSSDIENGRILILEGDYSNIPVPSYFSGIHSITNINLRSSNGTLEDIKTIPQELNGLSNVRDEYGKNKFIKRVGIWNITGDENWLLDSNTLSNTMRFKIVLDYIKPNIGNFICNNFPSYPHTTFNVDLENMQQSSNVFFIRISKSKLETQDVEGFKKWLKANPTTIYYELAKPIETSITDDIDLKTYKGITYLESNCYLNTEVLQSGIINNLSNNIHDLEYLTDLNKQALDELKGGLI